MPIARTPFDVPVNSQYDADSAPNQPYNCGPTTVVNALRYHLDRDFSINQTRRLATTRNGTGTNIGERVLMFKRRGLPASPQHYTPSQVKQRLNGRRAFDMALLMGRMPLAIRVRPFSGAHSVEAIGNGYAKCPVHRVVEPGIWVNDPNFHRSRGEGPRRFYPDHAWKDAYYALGGWCVVPDKDKVITTRTSYRHKCKATANIRARSGPGTSYTTVKVLPDGFKFSSLRRETSGGSYPYNNRVRRDWISLNWNGRLVWVAGAYVKIID